MKFLPNISYFVVGFHTWALDPGLSHENLTATAALPQNQDNSRAEGERGTAGGHPGGVLVSYGT